MDRNLQDQIKESYARYVTRELDRLFAGQGAEEKVEESDVQRQAQQITDWSEEQLHENYQVE
jgi:hypothetical protein